MIESVRNRIISVPSKVKPSEGSSWVAVAQMVE